MLDKELRILEILNKGPSISQRDIAKRADISIGKVNSIIKFLENEEYIEIEKNSRKSHYRVTDKGLKALESFIKSNIEKKIVIPKERTKKIKEAVILAAGEKQGFESPIGLLPLGDSTVIERTINILHNNGIENIIIITGYESSVYEYLKQKKGISLIKNDKYKWTGTMESLSLAKDYLTDDFILVEGDMVFEESAVSQLLKSDNRNCVLITSESGSGDEVFVEIRNGFIFKISKDKHQFNRIDGEMIGITKISIDIYNKMLEEFIKNENPFFNYEYALLDVARTYDIGYAKVDNLVWTEIDRLWQYKNLINYMYPMLLSKKKL